MRALQTDLLPRRLYALALTRRILTIYYIDYTVNQKSK